MKIERIHVRDYLGIESAELHTGAPVTIIAGRNGAGKSSLRDAIALALTADLGRVTLKKDAGHLVHDGADAAVVEVIDGDGEAWGVTISRGGKITDSQKGREADPTLPFVLDAQRFARLSADERRAFLFGLMGLKTDGPAIIERLKKRGCDEQRIARIAPLLRSGFEAAAKDAKGKATEAKGAWRAVTGETYGSQKAATWRASVPTLDEAAEKSAKTDLQHCDAAIESWQRTIGSLEAEEQRRLKLRDKLPGLQQRVAQIERIKAKLAADEADLARWESDLAKTAAAAGAAPRIGLVHELASALHALLQSLHGDDADDADGLMEHAEPVVGAGVALAAYEREHGKIGAVAGDETARARLPSVRNSRDTLARAVENDRRDLEAARQAHGEATAIATDLAAEFDATGLSAARQQVEDLKRTHARLQASLAAHEKQRAAAADAEQRTKTAAAHHADVVAWDRIGDALSPGGIPGEILAEALGPINTRLADASADTGWPLPAIDAEMAITAGGRAYRLLSESERWRVDAMIAAAIAQLSGARLLLLDRFDVLDGPARAEALSWFDYLAEMGEVDSVLLFGTLKQLPTGLPPTIGAHWIADGILQQTQQQPVVSVEG